MNNNRYYLLTGAAGFLGTNICMQLLEAGCKVRALVLPNDKSVKFIPEQVEVVLGDLTDAASLEAFFTVPEGCTSVVIHCASMVTVNPNYSEKLMAVNVGGTRNIITKVLNHPECEKMVYVSSTGAIAEQPHGTPITEVSKFTPCDPKKVVGAYSQSKATATQMVLDAVQVMGLKACVVHPSGILGPNDHAIGETTNTLLQIIKGEMPMGMQGSFNLCDVRDLAAGTIAAVDKGRIGECYILSNKTVTLKEMCDMLHAECNAKKIKFYLPLDLADKIAAGLEKQTEKTGKMPLMTTFSVYNLARNNEFDCTKARTELGYTTRSYEETIHDEVQWMIAEGLIDGTGVTEKHTAMSNEQLREGGFDVKEAYQAVEPGLDSRHYDRSCGRGNGCGGISHLQPGAEKRTGENRTGDFETDRRIDEIMVDFAKGVGNLWPVAICPGIDVFNLYRKIFTDLNKKVLDN